MTTTELPKDWAFSDPPPSSRVSKIDFSALLANPGKWVRTHHTYSSASAAVRKAAEKKHGGRWESCHRPAAGVCRRSRSRVFRSARWPHEAATSSTDPRPIADADAWAQHNKTVANPRCCLQSHITTKPDLARIDAASWAGQRTFTTNRDDHRTKGAS